jgi:hypothetical protein
MDTVGSKPGMPDAGDYVVIGKPVAKPPFLRIFGA